MDVDDISGLSLIQQVLVRNDGTVSHILESCAGEPISVVKLAEGFVPASVDCSFQLDPSDRLLDREILLVGRQSELPYVFAESLIAFDRLPPEMQVELLSTDISIGRLLAAHRLDTFREILAVWAEPAGPCAPHLRVVADDLLVARTYRIWSSGRLLFLITEKFPASAFTGA